MKVFFSRFDLITFQVKAKANSTVEQQKCKGLAKRDRLQLSKLELNDQISQ